MSVRDLDRVRRIHQLNALKIVSVLRIVLVSIMFIAIHAGVTTHWREQFALLSVYSAVALVALAVAFGPVGRSATARRLLVVFSVVDVTAVYGYKSLSPAGAHLPLMVMALLPLMVVLDVSLRRAAAVIAAAVVAFGIEVYTDPVLMHGVGWTRPTLVVLMYVFVCSTALLAVQLQVRHVNEIAKLTVLREQLLAQTMTASEEQQRKVSEFIHDGPLQYVLAARQDILEHTKVQKHVQLEHALASLKNASGQLREATFELHPAVLEHAGLAAAVGKLASTTAERSGIAISTDIDYPVANAVDSLVFGVTRELLSNVVRHSQATEANVTLKIDGEVCHLDVVDNGVGISVEVAAQQLAQGHIGLASQRARVEAAGGAMRMFDMPAGTHISVMVPLQANSVRTAHAGY
jgi:two-component system, NarL family, sensor kinase